MPFIYFSWPMCCSLIIPSNIDQMPLCLWNWAFIARRAAPDICAAEIGCTIYVLSDINPERRLAAFLPIHLMQVTVHTRCPHTSSLWMGPDSFTCRWFNCFTRIDGHRWRIGWHSRCQFLGLRTYSVRDGAIVKHRVCTLLQIYSNQTKLWRWHLHTPLHAPSVRRLRSKIWSGLVRIRVESRNMCDKCTMLIALPRLVVRLSLLKTWRRSNADIQVMRAPTPFKLLYRNGVSDVSSLHTNRFVSVGAIAGA